MTLAATSLVLAFVVGAVRAVELRRIGGRIDVINVVVVSAFAQQRGNQVPKLLGQSGPSVYLAVAAAITEATLRFLDDRSKETEAVAHARRDALVEQVGRDARAALIVATRRLRRYSWLDTVAVMFLGYAGIQVAIYGGASAMMALGMIGGTLLWLSNVLGVRHTARRFAVGAAALIQGLHRTLEALLWRSGRARGSPQRRRARTMPPNRPQARRVAIGLHRSLFAQHHGVRDRQGSQRRP
jgi:hypothetical protein